MNHGEKKQQDIVVSMRKSALCQSGNNRRDSLCAGELGHPTASCHWVSRIRPAYVCQCEKEMREGESCKHVSEKEKCGRVCAVCVGLFVSGVDMKLGHSLQLSRAEDELATEVG